MAVYEGVVGVAANGNTVAAHKALMHAVDDALLAVGCELVEGYAQFDIESLTTVAPTTSANMLVLGRRLYELLDEHSSEYPIYLRVEFGVMRLYGSLSTDDRPVCRLVVAHAKNPSTHAFVGSWVQSLPSVSSRNTGATVSYNLTTHPVYAVNKDYGFFAIAVAPGQLGAGSSPYIMRPYLFFCFRREFGPTGEYLGISFLGQPYQDIGPIDTAYFNSATWEARQSALLTAGFMKHDTVNSFTAAPVPNCIPMIDWPAKAASAGVAGVWVPFTPLPNTQPFHQLACYREDLAAPGDSLSLSVGGQEKTYKAIGRRWGFIPALGFVDNALAPAASNMGFALEWE